jgi:hypothetical protein
MVDQPTVSLAGCQRQLAAVWYLLPLPAMIALIAQTQQGVYEKHEAELWGWALPNFMPTLLLITGVVIVEQVQSMAGTHRDREVSTFARNATAGLSVFYLLVFSYVVFDSRAAGYSLASMQRSSVFLGPIQGLVGAALGVFFGTAKEVHADPAGTTLRPGPAQKRATDE